MTDTPKYKANHEVFDAYATWNTFVTGLVHISAFAGPVEIQHFVNFAKDNLDNDATMSPFEVEVVQSVLALIEKHKLTEMPESYTGEV